MHHQHLRRLTQGQGTGRDPESARQSRARIFAQSVLGYSPSAGPGVNAESSYERDRLEWLAQFSSKHGSKLRRLLIEEAAERRRQDYVDRFPIAAILYGGEWNPALHPRGGYPENPGWFSPADAGSAGAGAPQSSPVVHSSEWPFKTATSVLNDQRGAKLGDGQDEMQNAIAWQSTNPTSAGRGHHPVNQATTRELSKIKLPSKQNLLSDDAVKAFNKATQATQFYDHANDAWLGVSHITTPSVK